MSAAIKGWLMAERGGRLAAILTFVAALLALGAMLPAQGLTDDDDFYAPAGIRYAGWLGKAVTSPGEAFSQAGVDRAFKINNEHPPFAKMVIGAAHFVTSRWLPIYADLDGARFGVALLCALLCAVLVRLCWRPLGPLPALFSVLALLSMPRFVFHSQVATLDVPVAAMVVLTTAAFFWGETSRRWAWGTGLVFGLAMLTKLNAPFAAIPATLYALLCRWRGFGLGEGGAKASLRIPPIPRSLIAMALIGPVVFVAGWPWLWFDTAKRFGAYVAFHMGHYPIYLFYEGEIFTKPFAPWHMPFTLAAGVIPLPVLALGLVGAASAARALVRVGRLADETGEVPGASARDKLLALVLLQALFAIGVVAFSNVPKYGGEKLFMPFFPLFAVLAARGLVIVVESLGALLPRLAGARVFVQPLDETSGEAHPATRAMLAVVACAALLAVLPGYVGTVRFFGGFALSYYAEALGGLRGATARGYERTYYDIADKELARWLDANVQAGDRVHFEPNHKEYVRTYRWLQRDGYISRRVVLEGNRARANVLVLTHERRWSTYPALLAEHRRYEKIHEKRIDGVPLYTVYRRR